MKETKAVSLLAGAWQALGRFAILFVAFIVSLNARRLIEHLPHKNYGVENPSAANPEANYFAILAIIFSTVLVYAILAKLLRTKPQIFRLVIILIIGFSFFIGSIAPGVARYQDNVDTFHHGEQLAPALAYSEQGKKPYTDLYTLRGVGEDVITPWLSFRLFGTSIGSYYFLTGILQLISLIMFLLLVSYLFKSTTAFLIVSIWFGSSIYNGFYYIRDVFVWVAVALVVSIFSSPAHRIKKLSLLGFLAGSTLFYSFDRGIFLSALFALVFAALFFLEQTKLKFVFTVKQVFTRNLKLLYGAASYLFSLLLGVMFLSPSGFVDFIRTTFFEAAKYQGIIFNSPYSQLGPETLADWLPIITFIAAGYLIARTVYDERMKLSSETLTELILFIFSIIFFRAASGRPDIGHIAYGTPILFLMFFMVVFRRATRLRDFRFTSLGKLSPFVLLTPLLIFALFTPPIANYYQLGLMNQAPLEPVKTFLKSPQKPDEFWETLSVEEVSDYIKDMTDDNDGLFVLSSDPIYYYTTRLKNPTRYSISWFADASPLEDEMLEDLKSNPPKVILYESGTYYDRPDFIAMKDRLPKVNKWITENYKTTDIVSGATIKTK